MGAFRRANAPIQKHSLRRSAGTARGGKEGPCRLSVACHASHECEQLRLEDEHQLWREKVSLYYCRDMYWKVSNP